MNIVKLKTLDYGNKISDSFTDFCLYADVEKLSSDLNNIKTVSSLNNGDTVFIPSWVEFPRYKLREYGTLHNINITRDPAKADVIVIDKIGMDKLCYNVNWNRYNTVVHKGLTLRASNYSNDGDYFTLSNVNLTYTEGIEKILNYPTKRFITIADLGKITNTQGITLTEKHFDSLSRMLTSANSSDQELAMEQLANCNFEQSLVKLWILYSLNKSTCDRSKFAKSVNFSNLINYFKGCGLNNSNSYSNLSYSSIIKTLCQAGVEIDIEDLDILREGLMAEIEEQITAYDSENQGFKIHTFDVEFTLKRKEPVIETVKVGLELA